MNFEQLAGLIKAGFNEEQIKNIGSIMGTGTSTNTGTNTNTPTPAPTTTALPTPTVTPAPTSTPTTPPASAPASTPGGTDKGGTDKAGESETVTLLKEMLGLIQKGNINTVGTGTAAQETGVDVLAEILNPEPKTK